MTQAHIFYTGIVQGVGFRYTVTRFANELNLVGWVKNLSDGRVEAVIEGSKEDIESLLKQVEDYFKSSIQEKQIEYTQAQKQFQSFQIV